MKKVLLILVMAAILLTTYPACAARPLVTEDAGMTGKGKVYVEFGQEWVNHRNGDTESGQYAAVYYGITDQIDLIVEKPHGILTQFNAPKLKGFADSVFAFKYTFIKENDNNPAVGVKLFADFNDGHTNMTSGETEVGGILYASKELNKTMVHGNVSYTHIPNNPNIIGYSLALEHPLGEKFGIAAEIAGESDTTAAGPLMGQIGLTYKISESVVIDAGYSKGLNDAAPKNAVTVGASISF